MSSQKIVSVDPGGTCGYSILQKDNNNIELLEAGQKPWKEFLHYCDNNLMLDKYSKVVIEKYRIRRNTIYANLGKNLRTVKIIGVLEFLCEENDLDYHLQPAGIGKSFFDRKKLEKMNCWIVGKQHARDAIRHGLYYLTFGGKNDEQN